MYVFRTVRVFIGPYNTVDIISFLIYTLDIFKNRSSMSFQGLTSHVSSRHRRLQEDPSNGKTDGIFRIYSRDL